MPTYEPGDLLTRPGQYEFLCADQNHRILFNGTTMPKIMMLEVVGLMCMPESTQADLQRQGGDGLIAGTHFYAGRSIQAQLALLADSQTELYELRRDLVESMQNVRQPAHQPEQDGWLSFWREGMGKRLMRCHALKLAIPSNYDSSRGTQKAMLELVARDPRMYSMVERHAQIQITAGNTSNSDSIWMNGNWDRGTPVRLVINGPGLNPRINNSADDNRQIKLDHDLLSSETYTLHTLDKTVVDENGDSQVSKLGLTNQWWMLMPGENPITVSRTGTTGTLTLDLYWRDGYIA